MSNYTVDAAGGGGTADAPVFARASTGLVRELGAWRAFILTFGWVNLGSGAATFFAFAFFMYPGAIPWIPLTLGMLIGLIYGWVYVLLGHAMPRTGGDYVWTSRIVHPALGFGVSMLWMFLSIFLLAYQMSITTTVGISTSFGIMGAIYNNDGLKQLSANINTPAWTFAIGTGLLIIFAVLNIFSIRWTFRVLTGILILGIVSFLIIVFLFAVTSHDQFVTNYNALFGAGGFQAVIGGGCGERLQAELAHALAADLLKAYPIPARSARVGSSTTSRSPTPSCPAPASAKSPRPPPAIRCGSARDRECC